jgi:phage terminase small subunit
MALSAKQQRFIEEYILDWNATQAAIRAGYSKRSAYSQGTRLLCNAEITDAIRQIQTEKRNAAIMEYDEACAILSSIARGRIADYFSDDDRIETRRIRETNPAAVQSVEHDMHIEGQNSEPTYVHTTKLKLHCPIKAIQTLAKMRGWEAAQKHEVAVHLTLADMLVAAGMDDVTQSGKDEASPDPS